jgi:hypothetical protein
MSSLSLELLIPLSIFVFLLIIIHCVYTTYYAYARCTWCASLQWSGSFTNEALDIMCPPKDSSCLVPS